MAKGWQFGAGANRPEYPPGAVGGRPASCHLPGNLSASAGQLINALSDVVLSEIGEIGSEGVGFDAINANFEIGIMDAGDHLWSGHIQNLVAALIALEIIKAGIGRLQHGPHGAIGHYHP